MKSVLLGGKQNTDPWNNIIVSHNAVISHEPKGGLYVLHSEVCQGYQTELLSVLYLSSMETTKRLISKHKMYVQKYLCISTWEQ